MVSVGPAGWCRALLFHEGCCISHCLRGEEQKNQQRGKILTFGTKFQMGHKITKSTRLGGRDRDQVTLHSQLTYSLFHNSWIKSILRLFFFIPTIFLCLY